MRVGIVGLAILGALAACDASTASLSNEYALIQHQTQWEHRDFHSYTYDYLNSEPIGAANAHVTVVADAVTGVIEVTTGLPPDRPLAIPTIDSLFVYAQFLLSQKNTTVHLEFDSQLGYPTHVSAFDRNPGGGYNATVSNLQPTR